MSSESKFKNEGNEGSQSGSLSPRNTKKSRRSFTKSPRESPGNIGQKEELSGSEKKSSLNSISKNKGVGGIVEEEEVIVKEEE